MAEMTEMKVTNKKGAGFYIRAATNFLQGIEAKPAIEATNGKEGREAMEARAAVQTLTISGLGEAVNVAVAVAAKLEADSIAKIQEVKTSYPEMKDERGCAQIAIKVKRLGGAAPFLHKVCISEAAFVEKLMIDIMKETPELMQNVDAMKAAMLSKRKEWYESVAKPLLEKSFKLHDKDGNGVLDKGESAVFFDHLMDECCVMLRDSLEKMADSMFAQVMPAVGVTDPKLQGVMIKKIAPAIVKMMKTELLAILNREYYTRKDERDAAVFKIIDVNGDGRVQLSEFLAALSPECEDTYKKALGLDDNKCMEEIMGKIVPPMMEIIQREVASLQA